MVISKQLPGRRARRLVRDLTLLLLVLFTSLPAANAQQGDIILPTREASIRTALDEIDHQTAYSVSADLGRFDADRKVMFSSNRLSIRDVLAQALGGTGFTWRMEDRRIVLYTAPVDDQPLYSAMHRNSLPQQMQVVADPGSNVQLTSSDLARIRSGYWRRDVAGTDSLGLAVLNFRVSNTTLDPDYMDNRRTLAMIHRTFSNKDLLAAMDFITVTGAASPEGYTEANHRLAANRAMAIKNYIMKTYPFMDRDRIFTFSIGEDWSGLWKMVTDDLSTPMRESVLEIIASDSSSEQKRERLKALDNGRTFRYISENMLPYLRGAAACMIYLKEEMQPQYYVDTVRLTDTIYIHTREEILRTDTVSVKRPHYFAVKTNLLADAAVIPNLAFEYDLGRRWSVEVEGHWAWWNTRRSHKNCWRIQEVGVEFRKWLGNSERTPLTGHYLGLYGAAGTYDIRIEDKTGRLSDMSHSFGISYGYSLPIARSWNLEFGIGVGYLGGKYKKYHYDEVNDCFPWLETKNRHYFGPTKAKISLVWLLGRGKNWEKGSRNDK